MTAFVATPIPSPDFWRGKRVLLTGHSGFKGAWLALWLQKLGAQVTGLSLEPATEPNLFTLARVADGLHAHHWCDIRDAQRVATIVQQTRPYIVLHLAAQALVRASYAERAHKLSRELRCEDGRTQALRETPRGERAEHTGVCHFQRAAQRT